MNLSFIDESAGKVAACTLPAFFGSCMERTDVGRICQPPTNKVLRRKKLVDKQGLQRQLQIEKQKQKVLIF